MHRPRSSPWLVVLLAALLAPCLAEDASPADEAQKPQLLLQTAHGDTVSSLAVTPDGKYVASASRDGTVKLWELSTGRIVLTLHPPAYAGVGLAISPDGTLLATETGAAKKINLYRIPTGEHVKALEDVRNVTYLCFSPDGTQLASAGACDGDKKPLVTLWNVETGKLLRSLPGGDEPDGPYCVRFRSDGARVYVITHRGAVHSWDTSTGESVSRFVTRENNGSLLAYGNETDVSPDGRIAAIGWVAESLHRPESGVWLHDTETGDVIHKLDGPNDVVYAAVFSPDGRLLAIDDRVYDVETGQAVRSLKGGAYVLAFSPDGRHLVAGNHDGSIAVWEIKPPEQPALAIDANVSAARAVAFSGDDSRLAVADSRGRVSLWDPVQGQPLRRLGMLSTESRAVAISRDGCRVVAGDKGGELVMWDADTGEELWRLHTVYHPHDLFGGVASVHFSPDDALIATVGWTWSWDPSFEWPRRHHVLKVRYAEDGRIVHAFERSDVRHGAPPIAFTPHSNRVIAQDTGQQVSVWDTWQGGLLRQFEGVGRVGALAVTDDGRWVACGGAGKDGVRMHDLDTGECIRKLDAPPGGCSDLIFSGDRKRLTGVSGFGSARTWDLDTGETVHDARGYLKRGFSVRLSHDTARFAAPDPDGIGVYSTEDGRLLARLISLQGEDDKPGGWLVTTPEGYYKGTTDAARLITWRVGNEVFPLDAYRDVFYRPDLVEKALRGEKLDDVPAIGEADIPPSANIVAPEELAEVGSGHVTLTVVAQGPREITGLEVYTNGRRVSADLERGLALVARGLALEARTVPDQYRVTRTFVGSVPLPPGEERVRVRVVAVDEGKLRSRPSEVTVLQRGAKPVKGILHVLAVGISEHENSEYDLAFADDDARAVAEAVRSQGGPGKLYSGVHSVALTDAAATAKAVREGLQDLVGSARDADTVVLFLAGHGVRDPGSNYYLATHEVDLGNLGETAVPWDELQGLVRSLPAKQVLVMLDTCHSAGALGRYAVSTQALGESLADRAGVMVLASSSVAEKSYESQEWGHGAFTKAFLEALDGDAGKRLSPGVLEDFVGSRVAELTKGRQHPYVPIRTQFPAGTPILMGG